MSLKNKRVKVSLPKVQVSKTHRHVPILPMLLFVGVFAIAGTIFMVNSFASNPVVASVQGEAMSQPAGSRIISDSNASNGQALKLSQNGSATATVSLPSQATSVTIKARGSQCSGSPVLSLAIDSSTALANTNVSSNSYTTYTVTPSLAAGSHTVTIKGSNLGQSTRNNKRRTCSRSLYLDITTFYGPAPVATPAPSVTLSASPTSISVGGKSTLSWTSNNATTCTASGGWTGSKAVSGGETISPTVSSQYSITCNGSGGSANANTNVNVAVASPAGCATPTTSSINQTLGFKTLNCTVSDDFTGGTGTKPDATRWGSKNFGATNGSVVYWNGMNNVQLDGQGNLDIFAQRTSDGTHWNSGWISGNKSYSGTRYFEARAKVASGIGPWSGPIWEWDAPYGALGVENDVNEQLGTEPNSYNTTLHTSGTSNVSKLNTTGSTLANDYHTYGAAVYVDHVDYYLDGNKIQTITKAETGGRWGFVENPMVLNLDLDMGGWGCEKPPAGSSCPSTALPSTVHMLVDYIRVYTP